MCIMFDRLNPYFIISTSHFTDSKCIPFCLEHFCGLVTAVMPNSAFKCFNSRFACSLAFCLMFLLKIDDSSSKADVKEPYDAEISNL